MCCRHNLRYLGQKCIEAILCEGRIILAVLVLLFCPLSPVIAIDADTYAIEQQEATVIHIQSARFTSYTKGRSTKERNIETKDNDTSPAAMGEAGADAAPLPPMSSSDNITLSGDAAVSVERGGSCSVIRADTIRLDRQNSMIYASGNITVSQSNKDAKGDGTTETTAQSMLLNTNTMEGIFDGGRAVKLSDSKDNTAPSTLVVSSSLFGKGQNNTIAFKNGSLTFCDDEDPHWHIDASRIWMLPGGEFAFFNALIYMGHTPVLYLPAFYYPKDELIFNPVMGYDKKLGYFVQTTTYLYGRKSLDSYNVSHSSSTEESGETGFNFVKPTTLKQQRLEGLVLHNLENDYTGNTDNYIKFMADWYGNLGYGLGLDSAFNNLSGAISSIQAGFKMGVTQTVFCNSAGRWVPYAPSGESYDDDACFMGFDTPFRYEANFAMTLIKPFNLTIRLPIYSDPYFHDDFANRNETMDWINYLLTSSKGRNNDDDEDDNSDKERTGISNFEWLLTTNYSLPVIDAISPYLSSASISTKTSVSFATAMNYQKQDDTPAFDRDAVMLRSPNQKFFYPSIITPINANASFSGTLFEYNEGRLAMPNGSIRLATHKTGRKTTYDSTDSTGLSTLATTLTPPEELKSDDQEEDEEAQDELSDTPPAAATNQPLDTAVALPLLNASDTSVTAVPGVNYSLSYNFNPDYTSQIAYSSTGLNGPDDFEWTRRKSYMYTLHLPVSLTNSLKLGGEVANITNTMTYDPFWQDHPYLSSDTENGGYTEEGANSVMTADYTATKQTLTSGSTLSIKPFYYLPHFKNTGVTYRQDVKLFTTDFIGDAENPKWELLTTDWGDEEFVPTHQVQAILAATEGYNDAIGQTLTMTATLPPRPDEYNGELQLFVPHVSYTIGAGIMQKSSEDDTWVKQDLRQALTITLFDKNPLRFTASYNYSLEEWHRDSLKLSADWSGLQAAYQMSYTRGYDFVEGEGWQQRDEEEFLPYTFSLAYAPVPWTLYRWKNRIALKLGINTSIVSDLLKPTDSYFIFEPVIAFSIHEVFTIAFSATTKNTVIYRYVQKMFGCDGRIPGEDNLWKDLADSFRFDDEDLRRGSGFKLKSINVDISHSLHDWELNASYKMTPRLITEGKDKHYDFEPYATISVVWRPMSSLKTEIRDDYGHWQLNP